MTVEEIPLEGGNVNEGIVRVGDTVRRSVSAATPGVHALLRHFEAVGFDGAPRALGIDDKGREILSFLPGNALWPHQFQPLAELETLSSIGQLIRAFHDAVATFVPPSDAAWSTQAADPAGGDRIVHGDLGPWNIVRDDEGTLRLVDWDTAHPGRIEWDLSLAVLINCWLAGNVAPWRATLLSADEAVARIRAFAEGYGLDETSLRTTLTLIPKRCRVIAALIEDRAERGEAAWVQMRNDGHAQGWLGSAEYCEEHVADWLRLLFPLSA